MTDSRNDEGRRRRGDGDESGGDVVVERRPPDEAFGAVAHETRLRILQALGDADAPLAFSDLRRRVGVEDPGQFNYHLGELAGRFVRAADGTDGAEGSDGSDGDGKAGGYELAASGRRVVGGVLSGGYTKGLDADPVATDASCLHCGGTMETRFEGDTVRITCTECGMDFTNLEVPPGVLEGVPRKDAARVVDRWLKGMSATNEHGFCATCEGRVDRRVYATGDPDGPDWLGDEGVLDTIVRYDCRRCSERFHSIVPVAVLFHPAVVGFHYDHGVDLRETPAWDLDWLEPGLATVTQSAPLRVEVSMTLEEETLALTVDRSRDVIDERRR